MFVFRVLLPVFLLHFSCFNASSDSNLILPLYAYISYVIPVCGTLNIKTITDVIGIQNMVS